MKKPNKKNPPNKLAELEAMFAQFEADHAVFAQVVKQLEMDLLTLMAEVRRIRRYQNQEREFLFPIQWPSPQYPEPYTPSIIGQGGMAP